MDEEKSVARSFAPVEIYDEAQLDTLFIRNLVLDCCIGVHPHEHGRRQRVRFNVELKIVPSRAGHTDDPRHVVCYDAIIGEIRHVADAGHVQLVETMAERIAERCLAFEDVQRARICVEKLDRIPGASLGVEIERARRAVNDAKVVRLNAAPALGDKANGSATS